MPHGNHFIIVTIDGGAAAGKSSTAGALSERHHLLHVDTGSFYRAVTLYLLKRGLTPDDEDQIREALRNPAITTRLRGRMARIALDDEVPDEELRSPQVNEQVSRFASLKVVREFLLDFQRGHASFARENGFDGLVMEGRDIGSVIFPEAPFRFFLEADPEARNQRRVKQGEQDSIEERDRLDTQRKTAPLVCPDGAIRIDTTHMSLEEVIAKVSDIIEGDAR
jgi:CMP/dCMP kinase